MQHKVTFADISFPVYRLGIDNPNVDNGVVYYLQGRDTAYSDAEYRLRIVDDRNRPEASLAGRRLALADSGVHLFKLNKAIFFLSDLLKIAKGKTWFIDTTGKIFVYEKTVRVPLVFKKIVRITPIMTGGAIVEVQGLSNRFKVLHTPRAPIEAAGLLKFGNSYILYGLYDKIYDKTTRLI